jgi:Ca-activated chloride channel family protein
MLTLAYPWLLAFLPLPLLIWWLVPARHETRQSLVVPFLTRLAQQSGQRPVKGAVIPRGDWWRRIAVCLCWTLVILALARPQIIEPPVTKEVPVRDLVLAVDLSGSMATKDFKNARGQTVDRLTAVKGVLDDFLAKRQGDRVALIFFGTAPFVQAPFTTDLKVCRQLMDEAQVSMAGPQTAFGDAVGLAINLFDRSKVKQRVLIALTDGNDTGSQVPPVKAAQIAKDKGIVVYTVAVGDPRAVGEDALDEKTLKQVASTTGGLYAHAADTKQLHEIYDRLNKLETRKAQTISHRPRRDVYWWALAAALVVSMLFHALGLGRKMAEGWKGGRMETAAPVLSSLLPPILPSFHPSILPSFHPSILPSFHPSILPSFHPSLAIAIPAFHFIRPIWLVALIPVGLLWWLLRRQTDAKQPWRGIIAPRLLTHLLSGKEKKSRFGPLELIAIGGLLMVIAVAGPTWKHEPAPFANDVAAIAIVMKVSPSMTTEDVQPSRLARAVEKVHDLLKERGDAKTSLVAYAGSAHVVMPATKDSGIIDTFAQALDPKIMPVAGDVAADALRLADQTLVDAGGGSILWITDSIAPEQTAALRAWRKSSRTDVRLFPPLLPGKERDAVSAAARSVDARVVRLTADDSDVKQLVSAAKFSNVSGGNANQRWAESGYWLTPLIALLLLPFFRKGWMVSTAAAK